MGRVRFSFALVLATAICLFCVAVAGADRSYHTGHYALSPIAEAPLKSGFVQNIHANGPIVYAHEIYELKGAAPSSSYGVVLSIWTENTTCSGDPTLQLPTATVVTNGAGNGVASHVFSPADADGLRGSTVSAMWTVWNGQVAAYQTGCEVITLD
jgi:hypothetical protein